MLYDYLGKYDKAEPLYKRALEIDEKALGPDHPGVATRPQQPWLPVLQPWRLRQSRAAVQACVGD